MCGASSQGVPRAPLAPQTAPSSGSTTPSGYAPGDLPLLDITYSGDDHYINEGYFTCNIEYLAEILDVRVSVLREMAETLVDGLVPEATLRRFYRLLLHMQVDGANLSGALFRNRLRVTDLDSRVVAAGRNLIIVVSGVAAEPDADDFQSYFHGRRPQQRWQLIEEIGIFYAGDELDRVSFNLDAFARQVGVTIAELREAVARGHHIFGAWFHGLPQVPSGHINYYRENHDLICGVDIEGDTLHVYVQR